MIKKILIANRGEIAVRIVKACNEMEITSVAIYSDADKYSLHVRVADEAYHIGNSAASESYLDGDKIIELAKNISADAIHPGYGFLSENSNFIKKCEIAGIVFIGPSSKSVKMMGDKTSARKLMNQNNVPIVPGSTEGIKSYEGAKKIALEIGLPVMLKAASGGGGKGMRKIDKIEELKDAIDRAKNEAKKAFGDDSVYIEKFVENPKHIEVQILADKHGNYLHLFERDCSIQRRHQKLVEETPSPFMTKELRKKMGEAAIKAALAVNYEGVGTVEFLVDKNRDFYFMEMNTRIQVEHTITEEVINFDLVKEQIKLAAGDKISGKNYEPVLHAIQCRINAEDPFNDFRPSPGTIKTYHAPGGHGIRIDTHVYASYVIPPYYDSMIAKLITIAQTREEAILKMQRALDEYIIEGVKTTIPFHQQLMQDEKFKKGNFTTNFMETFKLKDI